MAGKACTKAPLQVLVWVGVFCSAVRERVPPTVRVRCLSSSSYVFLVGFFVGIVNPMNSDLQPPDRRAIKRNINNF